MKTPDWEFIENRLKKDLTDNRYRHTLGVTYTATALAMCYGADIQKARLAGLLHDCAKCIPNAEKISICKKEKIKVTDFELEHPVLLHAKLGAFVARTKYKVKDEDVLNAIIWHTTGKPEMTLLEKIVFIADYIEPNRDKAPHLDEIRRLAFSDLDLCVYEIMKDTIEYLQKNPKSMDTMTLSAYNYYKKSAWDYS